MISKIFEVFEKANSLLSSDIIEISVKVSQIAIMFDSTTALPMSDIIKLDDMWDNVFVTDITTFDDSLFVSYRDLNEDTFEPTLFKLITKLREVLCTCPAMECVISESYVKIYLNLPNIKVHDVYEVDKFLKSEGYLEINNTRPYILYINENANWVDIDEE